MPVPLLQDVQSLTGSTAGRRSLLSSVDQVLSRRFVMTERMEAIRILWRYPTTNCPAESVSMLDHTCWLQIVNKCWAEEGNSPVR